MTAQNRPPVKRRFFTFPSTRSGKWSVRVALGAIAIAVLSSLVLQLREGEDGFGVWYAIGLVFAIGQVAAGIAAFVLALIAIFRRNERSVLCLLPVLIGSFWLLFIAAEIFIGHE
jgi:hypothetical protein